MTNKYPKDFFGHPQGLTLSEINITREDIIDAIKTISQNSYGGPDEFPAILLKRCSKSLAHPLQLLYKASLKTLEIQIYLKWGIITPIYKDGSQNLPKNYRPVALASHLIKVLEKKLAKNIHQFLETHQKMNPKQHGFRSGTSCLSQLLEHHNKILEELEKSNNVDVNYLDFSKVFDKVDHGILPNKLKKIGINDKIGEWIHNVLSNRQQCVAVNETTSSDVLVRSGVPQGSVWGPLLFLIHISDINYEIADSKVSCCANDSRILLGIHDEEGTQMLQNEQIWMGCTKGQIQIIWSSIPTSSNFCDMEKNRK